MSTTKQPTTADLEPALNYLSCNPSVHVATIEKKFKLEPKTLWNWLARYNGSKKELPRYRIKAAIDQEQAAPKPKPVPAAAATRIGGAVHKQPAAVVRPPVFGDNVLKWLAAQNTPCLAMAETYQVKVGPELASSWLLSNQGNRKPSQAKIRRFAAAIKAGKWIVNGETIKFSKSGRLLDGQSRLQAIVMAGVPAVLELRAGLPEEAQKSMDIGETRKGTHTLEMMGVKYPTILSPALRLLFRFEHGALSYEGGTKASNVSVLENMEIEPMLKRHDGLRASVGWCVSTGYKICGLMPQSEGAFFHYLFGLASKAKRDGFFHSLVTGIGLTATSPAYHLREKLMADRASSKRMGGRERMALVIKAWNAHHDGRELTQLGFRATGDNREAFPIVSGVKVAEKG